MAITLGGAAFSDVYLGANKLAGVYVGATKVWPTSVPIEFIATGSKPSSGSSQVLFKPSEIPGYTPTVGDYVVCLTCQGTQNNFGSRDVTLSPGGTFIQNFSMGSLSGTYRVFGRVAGAFLTADNPDPSFRCQDGASGSGTAVILRVYRNVDPTTPVAGFDATSGSGSETSPTLAVRRDGMAMVAGLEGARSALFGISAIDNGLYGNYIQSNAPTANFAAGTITGNDRLEVPIGDEAPGTTSSNATSSSAFSFLLNPVDTTFFTSWVQGYAFNPGDDYSQAPRTEWFDIPTPGATNLVTDTDGSTYIEFTGEAPTGTQALTLAANAGRFPAGTYRVTGTQTGVGTLTPNGQFFLVRGYRGGFAGNNYEDIVSLANPSQTLAIDETFTVDDRFPYIAIISQGNTAFPGFSGGTRVSDLQIQPV